MPIIHPRHSHLLFAFLLSIIMSFIVSGVSVLKNTGVDAFTLSAWGQAWAASWIVAFPCVLLIAPIVRKLVAKLTT